MRTIAGLAFALIGGIALGSPAKAAEVKVLSAGVMKEVILTLKPEFEREAGYKLTVDVAPAGTLARRIEAGEPFDLVVVPRRRIEGLIEKGKVSAGSRTDLAGVGIGVVVKAGAPLPDISTVEAFKRAVLAAKSIAHTDPAAGATSGIYLAGLFRKLGIADEVNAKVTLVPGGSSAPLVARGEVELAVQQASEILNVPGTAYAGPLPPEIQNITVYSGGIGAKAQEAAAAKAFLAILSGPRAARLLKPHGLEPVRRTKK